MLYSKEKLQEFIHENKDVYLHAFHEVQISFSNYLEEDTGSELVAQNDILFRQQRDLFAQQIFQRMLNFGRTEAAVTRFFKDNVHDFVENVMGHLPAKCLLLAVAKEVAKYYYELDKKRSLEKLKEFYSEKNT